MRLIDAVRLVNDIIQVRDNDLHSDYPNSFEQGVIRKVLRRVEESPTISPEDLRPKGKWEPYYEDVEIYNAGGFTERRQTGWICGRCKSKASFTRYYRTDYCSNCGARMEE